MSRSRSDPSKTAQSAEERDRRLADALRANLRRRKSAAKKSDETDPSP